MSADDGDRKPVEGLVGRPFGEGLRIGIAAGLFNRRISRLLVEGARRTLETAGVAPADIVVAWAPGAFELPLVAQALADAGCDAVVCLGAVIRGETTHYDFVAGECAAGIRQVSLEAELPVIFGVLTTENLDQALARSGGPNGHKGEEAARAALEMVDLLRRIEPAPSPTAQPDEGPSGPRLYQA